MGTSSFVDAKSPSTEVVGEKQSITVDVYVGVFFDGTNNNKYQVMLGKMFRWEKIYNKHKWELKKHIKGWNVLQYSDVNMYSIIEYPRSYWESGPGKGIFTRSELEYMYYGYGDINDTTSGWRSTFIEQKSQTTLENNDINQISAIPDDEREIEKLKEVAGRVANNEEGNGWLKDKWKGKLTDRSVKGAPAQNATYTNVAILESLYKCEDKSNDKGDITEKHISVYVEGSGADMQLEADPKLIHKSTMGLAGLGLGTGPAGVAAKVRKASSMIQRLLDKYGAIKDVSEIKFHFDLFGFSRGSTCARIMAYVINPKEDENSITKKDEDKKKTEYKFFTARESEFLPTKYINASVKKEIRFMGLFDTVSSIGVKDEDSLAELLAGVLDTAVGKVHEPDRKNVNTIWENIEPYINPALQTLGLLADLKLNTQVLDKMGEMLGYSLSYIVNTKMTPIIDKYKERVRSFIFKKDIGTENLAVITEGKSLYHKDNVKDYGLWATKLAEDVVHICALDEVRKNFALVDIQSSIDTNGTEIFIPGCHTDIGGGASIGMDDPKLLRKGDDLYLPSYKTHNKAEIDNSVSVSVDALKTIGWLNIDSNPQKDDKNVDETYYIEKDNFIKLFRFVKPGYSNVSLNYIHSKWKEHFHPIPKSYEVPSDLEDLLKQMQTLCNGKQRYFLYPKEKEQYFELRRKYLHLSFNEQSIKLTSIKKTIADNNTVNGPEYTRIKLNGDSKEIISRIIYPGALDAKPMHMFDYEDGHPSQNIEVDEPPQSGLHPALSGDYTGFEEYDPSNDHIFISFPDYERVE